MLFSPQYFRRFGSKRVVGYDDEDLGHHGDLMFYAAEQDLGLAEDCGGGLVEFHEARFSYAGLDGIGRFGEDEDG